MLLYADEATYHRQPTQAKIWFPKGRKQPPMKLSYKSNHQIREAAALNAVDGRVVHCQAPKMGVKNLCKFIKKIVSAYPNEQIIYLVWDNWPVHKHPKVMEEISKDTRLKVLWLPTYSPWLNYIEKLWKYLKQKLTHAHAFSNFLEILREKIIDILESFSQGSLTLLKYVGLSTP